MDRELLASQICRCFDVSQVFYEEDCFDDEKVTISENITSMEYSIVSMEAFEIYAQNHDMNVKEYILNLDKHNYYMMNVVGYLIGNTDRHWGNWGIMVNNLDNMPVCFHKLMDFNQVFNVYDSLEGANCQTTFGAHVTQKDAAIQAVKEIGLNQIKEIDKENFSKLSKYYDMFCRRLQLLKEVNALR